MKNKKSRASKVASSKIHMSNERIAHIAMAAYIVLLLMLQLFTFEKFPQLLGASDIYGVWAVVVAIILVVAELMSLPFLLRMKTSKTLKLISAVSGVVALAVLTTVEVIASMSGQTVMFGATLSLPGGVWSLFLLVAFWILTVWGMYEDYLGPLVKAHSKPRKSR